MVSQIFGEEELKETFGEEALFIPCGKLSFPAVACLAGSTGQVGPVLPGEDEWRGPTGASHVAKVEPGQRGGRSLRPGYRPWYRRGPKPHGSHTEAHAPFPVPRAVPRPEPPAVARPAVPPEPPARHPLFLLLFLPFFFHFLPIFFSFFSLPTFLPMTNHKPLSFDILHALHFLGISSMQQPTNLI